MREEYTQQTINRFYAGFKKLPSGYNIEKVHQLINNPYAEARHKVNIQSNYLKPIIMTSTILIGLSALFLWLNPVQKAEEHLAEISNLEQNQEMQINSDSKSPDENQIELSTEQNYSANESNRKSITKENEKNDEQQLSSSEKTDKKAEQIKIPVAQKTTQNSELETIDGNKFILDLTFDELRNLGFNITHNTVFYRNSNVIFSSALRRVGLKHSINSNTDAGILGPWIRDLELQKDTFPSNADFFYIWRILNISRSNPLVIEKDTFKLVVSTNTFLPIFTTELDGTTKSVFRESDFEQQNDTLVPIVLRFYQLNAGRTKDLIFWVTPTDELFEKLPDRYSLLKPEFNKLKDAKKNNPNFDYVHYDIDGWVMDQLFTEEKIDGESFIISLSDKELENLGCFRNERGGLIYNFKTINRGTSTGGKPKEINGRKTIEQFYDTTFYTDYLPVFNTYANGFPLATGTTSKELDNFLIENDKSLPVLIKYPDWKDFILWFSLSEDFWKRIPERYQYLKGEYDKILFNKSLFPDKDLVQYIQEPFEKMDINVKILELNKEELENIGFLFGEERLSIDCSIDQSWIQYESIDVYSKVSEARKNRFNPLWKMAEYVAYKPQNGKTQRSKYINKDDSLLNVANKGYLFLGITDTLGRVLHDIPAVNLLNTEEALNQDLLIPILVEQSKYYREYAEDKVFWFTPTKEFIERLPNRYRTDLQNEIEQIRTKSASACNYFEICKSTLQLENLKVYPNPASNAVTIEFETSEELTGSISVVGITGSVIKELVPETTFFLGFNVYQTDLSGIAPGIYLVYINTGNGFKTQRLIVSL